jgi:AcrR family transcriptional regulator
VATTRSLDPNLTIRIRSATLELLAERGFRDLRLDDVAARVGTSKQALYRRFTSKSELIADAVLSLGSAGHANPPRTGSLRRDLIAALGGAVRGLERTALAAAMRALVAEERDELLARALAAVEESRRRVLRTVLEAARERGELARNRDIELDLDLLLGAAYVRAVIRRVPLDRTLAERIVDAWLGDALAHSKSAPRG